MIRPRFAAAFVVTAAFVLAGCRQSVAPAGLATTTMTLGHNRFVLEIANTDAAREHGLMKRDSMPADHGMIFVFANAQPLSFYMLNTRIPLDIVFIDAGGRVISIKQMKPYDVTPIPSEGLAKWAIELNKGAAADAGVRVGDVVEIPAEAREAK